MRSRATFAARLRLRRGRGAALLEALLALALLGVLATGAVLFLESRTQARLEEEAGRQVAILGYAAAHYARTHYADNTAWPAGGQLSFANPGDPLRARGILPASFSAADAMKRSLRVWYRRVGTHPNHTRIQILAGQHGLGAGDERVPLSALFAGGGRVHTGVVRTGSACRSPLTSPCLVGPAVAESLGWASPVPEEHAVMASYEVTREEYCGGLVLREATAICPDSGRIMGDLDMGGGSPDPAMPGHDLLRIGTLTVADPGPDGTFGTSDDPSTDGRTHELAVREDMTVTGTFGLVMTAEGDGLAVGRHADVTNAFTVSGGLSVYGDVRATQNLTITNDFGIRGDLDVTRRIDGMATVRVTGTQNPLATISGSDEALNVQILRVGTCPNCTR